MFLLNPYWPAGPTDPAFGTVVHLAHFDGTDGQTGTLTNSCPRGNAMTAGVGNGELDTALKVFGTASLLRTSAIPGTAGAGTSTHVDYEFGTNDFTIEFLFRFPTLAQAIMFDMRPSGAGSSAAIYCEADGRVKYFSTVDRITGVAGTLVAATWQLFCYSRVSGTGRLFVNGVQVGSSYTDSANYSTAVVRMGGTNINPISGSWDELRVSNGAFGAGAGRYSANYTPAIAAFPNS